MRGSSVHQLRVQGRGGACLPSKAEVERIPTPSTPTLNTYTLHPRHQTISATSQTLHTPNPNPEHRCPVPERGSLLTTYWSESTNQRDDFSRPALPRSTLRYVSLSAERYVARGVGSRVDHTPRCCFCTLPASSGHSQPSSAHSPLPSAHTGLVLTTERGSHTSDERLPS